MNNIYLDREQTEAKHEVLRRYLEGFAYKVLSTYGSIDFVDAFCGPWEERDTENLSDTSIGIALTKLQSVAEKLDTSRGNIRCIFNEKDESSFQKLEQYIGRNRERFNRLEIHTMQGAFEDNAAAIKSRATNNFLLLFVDPTGWRGFSPDAIGELAGQRSSEVIINFMHSFIQRFLCNPRAEQEKWLRELLGAQRAKRLAGNNLTIETIESELIGVLKNDLGFKFAAQSPIHNPDKNVIHFRLFYATNHPAGVAVLRDAEFKALSSHDQTRFKKAQNPAQDDLFGSEIEVLGPYLKLRREQHDALPGNVIVRLESEADGISYGLLRAQIQEKYFITKSEVGDLMLELAQKGKIKPTWKERGGRRPNESDKIILAAQIPKIRSLQNLV